MLKKTITLIGIFSIVFAIDLPEIGEWEIVDEFSLPDNSSQVLFSEPTSTESGKPLVWRESHPYDDRNRNEKIYNVELGSYIYDEDINRDREYNVGDQKHSQRINVKTKVIVKHISEKIIPDDSLLFYGIDDESLKYRQWKSHYFMLDLYGNELSHSEISPEWNEYNTIGGRLIDCSQFTFHFNSHSIRFFSSVGDMHNIFEDVDNVPYGGGASLYRNTKTGDHLLRGEFHESRPSGYAVVVDNNNNILWKRRTDEHINVAFSPSGNYFLIRHLSTTGEIDVEVVDRTGFTVNTLQDIECTVYGDSELSLITSNDMYFISTNHFNTKLNVFDLFTSESINTFVFNGLHPIHGVKYSNEKELIFVLFYQRIDSETTGKYIGVHPLGGSSKRPLAQIKFDEFEKGSKSGGEHMSVSDNGEEITVMSGKKIKTYRLTIGE